MPAPSSATYSSQAKIDAHTAFLALVDAGTAGSVKVYDNSDVLLATHLLQDPGGTVNGTTGQLTMAMSATIPNAVASGTAAYANVTSSAGTVHLGIPAQQGTVAVSGKVVFNTLTIISGAPVQIVSVVIG
jgi:hypothetical protein